MFHFLSCVVNNLINLINQEERSCILLSYGSNKCMGSRTETRKLRGSLGSGWQVGKVWLPVGDFWVFGTNTCILFCRFPYVCIGHSHRTFPSFLSSGLRSALQSAGSPSLSQLPPISLIKSLHTWPCLASPFQSTWINTGGMLVCWFSRLMFLSANLIPFISCSSILNVLFYSQASSCHAHCRQHICKWRKGPCFSIFL